MDVETKKRIEETMVGVYRAGLLDGADSMRERAAKEADKVSLNYWTAYENARYKGPGEEGSQATSAVSQNIRALPLEEEKAMTILTKEQVEELRLEHDKRKMSNDSNYEKCLDTIDNLYSQVEALERVKDCARGQTGPKCIALKMALASYDEAERKKFK